MTKSKKPTSKPKKQKAVSNKPNAESGHYVVLARKYRPQTFDDLIGQDAMVQTLRNAFETGRIAQAYMLTGVRGVGKTTTARILARALNYTKGDESVPTIHMPEHGEHCAAIMESRHVDVLEMDAASHTGVDNIRELIESARYKPVSARYKVYIIDEVHMLSKGAFNALLKTLEEPPEHVKFIFATTEVRKVPVTVLSRCQRFDLRRVDKDMLIVHFNKIAKLEKVKADDEALGIIARATEGSVRDGLSLLDQAMALGAGKISGETVRGMLGLADRMRVFQLLETVFQGDAGKALGFLDELHSDGAEPGQIIADLAEAVHLITRIKATSGKINDQTLSETERSSSQELANKLSMAQLGRAWQMLLKGINEVNCAPRPIAAVEMVLIRMAYMANLPTPDELIRGYDGERSLAKPNTGRAQGETSSDHTPTSNNVLAGPSGAQRAVGSDTDPSVTHDAYQTHVEPITASQKVAPELKSFEDVVAYVGEKRDVKLKIGLEEHARLVHFKTGHIELQFTEGAPNKLANELGRKLTDWTGERWIVVVSSEEGQNTIAEQRRAREAAELDRVKEHPFVKHVFETFPEAQITAIREPGKDGPEDSE